MRGTKAKACRRAIYGDGGSGRTREWSSDVKPDRRGYRLLDRLGRVIGETVRTVWRWDVRADARRQAYQALKRSFQGRSWKSRKVDA